MMVLAGESDGIAARTAIRKPSRESGERHGHNLLTVPETLFATQMSAPSKAIPSGFVPALNVPRFAPSAARSLVLDGGVLFQQGDLLIIRSSHRFHLSA
jgi:hypothetical protein